MGGWIYDQDIWDICIMSLKKIKEKALFKTDVFKELTILAALRNLFSVLKIGLCSISKFTTLLSVIRYKRQN